MPVVECCGDSAERTFFAGDVKDKTTVELQESVEFGAEQLTAE